MSTIRPCSDDERDMLAHLRWRGDHRMLVGTWGAADWAIRFYEGHGFELVSGELNGTLLQNYWTIPKRQIETSVVLASPPFSPFAARAQAGAGSGRRRRRGSASRSSR